MSEVGSYWTRRLATRRAALRGALIAGGGVAALSLVGCGGDDDGGETQAPAASTKPADETKGVQGGKIVIQQYGDPGAGLELVKTKNAGVHQFAGFTHEGLLEFRNGTPAFDGYDITPRVGAAQAMPEQSADQLSFIFKLEPAKFHNGTNVTSQDVKYSYERYAFGSDSAYKGDWTWLEKVDTPDPQTVVVKTKFPYADALQSMAARNDAEILSQAWEESPEHEKKLMGSGPFLFVEYTPPVISRYKRNPEYHRKPFPYFEAIDYLETSDPTKKVADFISHQTHMTYWFPVELAAEVRKGRPDAQSWEYVGGGSNVNLRNDQPPFNDTRIRQAFAMGIDRQALIKMAGVGVPDGPLSQAGRHWQFRPPEQLGASAKFYTYDPQAAKQLLSAAGVATPIEGLTMPHWNATVIGQNFADSATLMETSWRAAGIANVKDQELTFGQVASTLSIGNYTGLWWGANTVASLPNMGIILRNQLWSPPEGPKAAPTVNIGYIHNPELSGLVEKQLSQFNKEERIQTLRRVEDIMAANQFRLNTVTGKTTWFGDPSVVNMQTARDAYNGATPYIKYWWFKDGKAP